MKRVKYAIYSLRGYILPAMKKNEKKMEKKKNKRGKARKSNFADIINESFEK